MGGFFHIGDEDVRILRPIPFHASHKEEDLQLWADENPLLLNNGQPMLSLGTEIKTRHDHYIDNLFLDGNGYLVVAELKRGKSPRDVTAQAIDYGVRGVGFNFVAGKAYGRVEIYIDRGEREENKWIFDQLHQQKDDIEATFGGQFIWQRLEDKRACRIKAEMAANIFEREQWPEMIEFMTDAMVRLENAFREPLAKINEQLKAKVRT